MDYGTSASDTMMCPHCGMGHTGACPRVKAIEYHPNGTVKRVEYFEPQPIATAHPTVPYPLATTGGLVGLREQERTT